MWQSSDWSAARVCPVSWFSGLAPVAWCRGLPENGDWDAAACAHLPPPAFDIARVLQSTWSKTRAPESSTVPWWPRSPCSASWLSSRSAVSRASTSRYEPRSYGPRECTTCPAAAYRRTAAVRTTAFCLQSQWGGTGTSWCSVRATPVRLPSGAASLCSYSLSCWG